MHGLVNRSVQCFLRDTYGPQVWGKVSAQVGLGAEGFEPMLVYPADITNILLKAACDVLRSPRETVLEDLGTYLVSHPNVDALRRLLRFGGPSFVDFLHSLEDLPERAHLAVADLDVPEMALTDMGDGDFRLLCRAPLQGVGHVVMGILRAMADEYGALVVLDHDGSEAGAEVIHVRLLDQAYAEGRRFDLALRAG